MNDIHNFPDCSPSMSWCSRCAGLLSMTECSVLARVDHASLWKQMMTLVPRSCSALAVRQLGGRGSGSCLLTLIRSLDTNNEVRFHTYIDKYGFT